MKYLDLIQCDNTVVELQSNPKRHPQFLGWGKVCKIIIISSFQNYCQLQFPMRLESFRVHVRKSSLNSNIGFVFFTFKRGMGWYPIDHAIGYPMDAYDRRSGSIASIVIQTNWIQCNIEPEMGPIMDLLSNIGPTLCPLGAHWVHCTHYTNCVPNE